MNKNIMIIISILLIFIICVSSYLTIKENHSRNFLVSTGKGCNLETHHNEYNGKTGKMDCVEGEAKAQ